MILSGITIFINIIVAVFSIFLYHIAIQVDNKDLLEFEKLSNYAHIHPTINGSIDIDDFTLSFGHVYDCDTDTDGDSVLETVKNVVEKYIDLDNNGKISLIEWSKFYRKQYQKGIFWHKV